MPNIIIDVYENELLHNLDKYRRLILSKVESVQHEYETRNSKAVTLAKNTEMLDQFTNDVDLIKQMHVLQRELCTIIDTEQQVVTWNNVPMNVKHTDKSIKAILGQIRLRQPITLR